MCTLLKVRKIYTFWNHFKFKIDFIYEIQLRPNYIKLLTQSIFHHKFVEQKTKFQIKIRKTPYLKKFQKNLDLLTIQAYDTKNKRQQRRNGFSFCLNVANWKKIILCLLSWSSGGKVFALFPYGKGVGFELGGLWARKIVAIRGLISDGNYLNNDTFEMKRIKERRSSRKTLYG